MNNTANKAGLLATTAVLCYSAHAAPVAPALENYTSNLLLGEVWQRPGLSPRDRSIVTVATLIARQHGRGQLRQGIPGRGEVHH